MAKKKLLVVEDDPGLQRQLRWRYEGYEVIVAGDREQALAAVRRHEPPVVLMDLGLPPDPDGASEGLALLPALLAEAPDTKVIILSGNGERANALRAVGMGAYDFHHKPCQAELLGLVIERAFVLYGMQQENRRMQQVEADSPLAGIVTRAPAMLRLCRAVDRAAPAGAAVLLQGEPGCGKEVVARALHRSGPRREHRFVAISCAAIPEALLESELFGHGQGASIVAGQQGKIGLAHGGTLFLDEVGDMAPAVQARLLRFVQERAVERAGDAGEAAPDVRIVCATHHDLASLVRAGRFREDLFYRLSEIVLAIPPLRERPGDAALLAHHFRNRWCAVENRTPMRFAEEALAAIEHYPWPGNVRELENCIKRAVIMAEGPLMRAADLGLPVLELPEPPVNLRRARDAAEYEVMVRALARTDGNIARAAELLGVSRPTVYDLMHYHGIRA
jgi:two-component system NtrC family response regulator